MRRCGEKEEGRFAVKVLKAGRLAAEAQAAKDGLAERPAIVGDAAAAETASEAVADAPVVVPARSKKSRSLAPRCNRLASESERQGLSSHGSEPGTGPSSQTPDQGEADRASIETNVARITPGADEIAIELTNEAAAALDRPTLQIAWSIVSQYRHREILAPAGAPQFVTPMRHETRETLVAALGRGYAWLDDLMTGAQPDIDAIARRENRSKRTVHMMLSLAFLSPDITAAAIAGKLPPGVALRQLVDLPADWTRQRIMLGLA